METIFDHNPTDLELDLLRFTPFDFFLKFNIDVGVNLTPEIYKKKITEKFAYYDLALLYDLREDETKAKKYYGLYGSNRLLGMDYEIVTS